MLKNREDNCFSKLLLQREPDGGDSSRHRTEVVWQRKSSRGWMMMRVNKRRCGELRSIPGWDVQTRLSCRVLDSCRFIVAHWRPVATFCSHNDRLRWCANRATCVFLHLTSGRAAAVLECNFNLEEKEVVCMLVESQIEGLAWTFSQLQTAGKDSRTHLTITTVKEKSEKKR